jgi:CheY-like chemotaxis protein
MSKRILVMEDEKDNRQIIRDLLGGIDCEITEAEDAEQARCDRSPSSPSPHMRWMGKNM